MGDAGSRCDARYYGRVLLPVGDSPPPSFGRLATRLSAHWSSVYV